MSLGADKVVVRTPFEDFFVQVRRGGPRPDDEGLELARWAASQFRLGIDLGDPGVVRAARQLVRLLDGEAPGLAFGLGSDFDDRSPLESAFGGTAARLERELLAGQLVVERERVASLTERRDTTVPKLPPLAPPPRESGTHTFEVRFVDEIGRAISGIDAEFTADGAQTRATNAAGIALLEGVQSSSASVEILDLDGLSKVLDPRWESFRPGKPPKESNSLEVVFRGGELGPFSLKAEVPNRVVIKPPLGKLFVELWDKMGRVRHANRTYQITGPQSFAGTTDDDGRLLHEDVFPGDYQLSLALDFFEETDPDRSMDIVDGALVVLEPDAAQPQVRRLGAVPRSVLARLQLFFNTNKTFLLPTALPSVTKLRKLYFENAPCQLLVVGHADTRGNTAFNDKLSLERARATVAYLKDDVEGWFEFYGQDADAKKRWGKTEDHLMIISMPDFGDKPKGEDAVKWYQRTRGLEVDGDAGKQTRHALIEEYMALDGASLQDFVGAVDAIPHGCGENFPLEDATVDSQPEPAKRHPGDRRVELFFFDAEFGITPQPASENSQAQSPEYALWRKRVSETVELGPADLDGPKVDFIEIADSLFRTNSAVVLPEGEAPNSDPAQHQSLSSVSSFAMLLRLNEEHPGKQLFVAGHTDTAASEDFNQKLSQERAECALAVVVGDRQAFVDRCQARHTVGDYKQILAWVSRAFSDFSFSCDPGKIDDQASTGVAPVKRFQTAYNANRLGMGIAQPAIGVDGSVGKETWGAFFDCYEVALARELGEDESGVQALRDQLVFVDSDRKALGFGEYFPIEELGVDKFRSQANRRVELMLFDPGEEPDLVHAQEDPETSELYLPGHYQREPLPTRPGGAKPHMTLTLSLFRPDGTRSGVSYELINDDGTFSQKISESEAATESDQSLLLEFEDVPMGAPLTLRQLSGSTAIDLALQVPPAVALTSAPLRTYVTTLSPRAEDSTSFLDYDLQGALA